MAKVEKKKVEPVGEITTPMVGMTAKDLSPEKRIELFQKAFDEFKQTSADTFGLTLGVEIAWTPRAAVPRMIVIDLLKENENPNQPNKVPNKTQA